MYNYFKPHKEYFWDWEVEHSNDVTHYIATIPNGQSIAYYATILEDLEDLTAQGIPPFGALLLVLIAISTTIQEETYTSFKNDLLSTYGEYDKKITNALEVLGYIKNLPEGYKKGATKTALLQLLFKDCHNRLGLKKSQNFFNNAKMGLGSYNTTKAAKLVEKGILEKDFKPIALLIRRFKSTEDIITAMHKASISEDLEEDIEIEESLPFREGLDEDLVTQLTAHNSTYQIGSLIKRIWSGLNIPMNSNLPSNQPLGGVSDITNKGDFDRLLISEFANDEDVFMSRIVNNEALYIERETPPENNTRERIFLIDNSLKNWGVPKILSFATTLAITNHPKSDFTYKVYVVGESYEEISIASILSIIDSQNLLSGSLHCADGLQLFFEENIKDNQSELFFLTTPDTLNYSSLQNVIYNYNTNINYMITTDVDGNLNFYKNQNKKRKHFQHILLPYEEIWKDQLPKPTIQKPLKNKDVVVENLLLEPINKSNAIIIPFGSEIYVIQDLNLYSLTSKGTQKGLQLIYKGISHNHTKRYTIIRNEKNERILVSFSNRLKLTERINLQTKEVTSKVIYSKYFDAAITILFTLKDEVILTNKTDFWSISEASKLSRLNVKTSYSEGLLNYEETIFNFRRSLRMHKVNYNIFKNIEAISIVYNSIDFFLMNISGFTIEKEKLSPMNKSSFFYSSFNNSKEFEVRASLYLKHIHNSPLVVIKSLKEILDIGLNEAKTLVSTNYFPKVLVNDIDIEKAETLQLKIEAAGTTCFIKKEYFETKDGSTIRVENGQLIFKSSKTIIPQFYVTSVLGFEIAMTTKGEFAGNEYFLPVNNKLTIISVASFYDKYVNPFIKHIIAYED